MKHSQLNSVQSKGFALVATLSLMILLTVIAVGLLTLSAISSRGTTQEQAQLEAQANARLALAIAIGELQKQVGPDQRVSANSAILSANPVPNPQWTGVWDSWIAGDLTSAPVNPNYPSGPNSAHQTLGDQADPRMRPNYANKSRHFRGWLLSLLPEDVINIYAPMGPVLLGKNLPQTSDDAVQLVAKGSLGASGPATDYVSARLIDVEPKSNQSEYRGRYAWWVGDESQKATIMEDSYSQETSPTMAERIFRQESPANMGNTSITGLENLNDETQLTKVATKGTVGLLAGVDRDESFQRFHDITTSSYGVLADVREGGLKRDLSTILERNIDPDEVYDFTTVVEFKRPSSIKTDGQGFMLYNFDSMLTSVSPTGMANVPIQDLAAYYQLYDHNRPGWKGGVQFSSSQSSPPNSLLSNGAMVSTPDLGYSNTSDDYDKYLRQYTYQYRRAAPVKQELVLHYITEARTQAEIDADPATLDADPLTIADPYKLRIGLTPSMTFWNPNNIPIVMNDATTFPLGPGAHPMGRQDKTAMTWSDGTIPLTFNFKKGTSANDPAPKTFSKSMASMYDSGFQPLFYTNGNFPLIFQPGESKVLSLQGTSLTNPNGGLIQVDFQNRGGGGGTNNEHFMPELELIPGWNPDKFVRSSNYRYAKAINPILTFKSTDYISVDVVAGSGDFGFTSIATVRQARQPYPMYHHHVFDWLPRYQADPTFTSNFVHMGFPRTGRGGIASTTPRPISIPPRQAAGLISAMGNPNDLTDDIPQSFFYFSRKAAVETHESRNVSPPSGGAGRRFPARPFLHAPFAQSAFFDNIDGASLYDFGWSWFFMPLNNMLDAPISISGSNSGYYGGGYTAESGTTHLVQQQLPLTPPISIAALSHARLGGYSLATEAPCHLFGNWPWPDYRIPAVEGFRRVTATGFAGLAPNGSQAIGNSYAHPNIPAGKAFTTRNRMYVEGVNTSTPFVDHSYLANKALWDDFFFSSITPVPADNPIFNSSPKTVAEVADEFFFDAKPLPNRRIMPYTNDFNKAALTSLLGQYTNFSEGFADKIAAHLMVNGSFNINSTSVEAWKAVFSGLKGKPVAYLDKDTALTGGVNLKQDVPTGVPISAGGVPNAKSFSGSPSDPSDQDQWLGWRELSKDEIEELAKAMVRQVKKRGPFLSLSEFVNRRLDSSDPELSAKGALQAALDDPAIPDAKAINGGFRNADRKFTSAEKSYVGATFPEALEGAIAYGSSAYVDQADVLRNLAEQLTPRGDTFVIRTYGDSIDASGKVVARAWCEAVVQRNPDYVDSKDESHLKQSDLSSASNKKFGRKLNIVKFRWLNGSEI